jgi:hypothetical protein
MEEYRYNEPHMRQAGNSRWRTHELNDIERLVIAHREEFLHEGHHFFRKFCSENRTPHLSKGPHANAKRFCFHRLWCSQFMSPDELQVWTLAKKRESSSKCDEKGTVGGRVGISRNQANF